MPERRIVEQEHHDDGPNRSRGPIIGLVVVLTLVLVALIVFFLAGEGDDTGDDVRLEDIEVDVGDDG